MTPTTDEVIDALHDVLGASTIQPDPVRAQQMADLAITRARRARHRRLPVMATHGYAVTALDQAGRVIATQRTADDTGVPG